MTAPLPHAIASLVHELGALGGRLGRRLVFMVAAAATAALAAGFLLAALYTALSGWIGALPAQLAMGALFALATALLLILSARGSARRRQALAAVRDGTRPDDWAGRLAGSLAYGIAEGFAHRHDGPPPPPTPPPA